MMRSLPANRKNHFSSPWSAILGVVFIAAYVLYPYYHLLTEAHSVVHSVSSKHVHTHGEGQPRTPSEHSHNDNTAHHQNNRDHSHSDHPASDHELIMTSKVSTFDFVIYPIGLLWNALGTIDVTCCDSGPRTSIGPFPSGPPPPAPPSRAPPLA